jgi:hypothetical protein
LAGLLVLKFKVDCHLAFLGDDTICMRKEMYEKKVSVSCSTDKHTSHWFLQVLAVLPQAAVGICMTLAVYKTQLFHLNSAS